MDRKEVIETAYGRKKLTDLTVADLPDILEYITIILDDYLRPGPQICGKETEPDKDIVAPELEYYP